MSDRLGSVLGLSAAVRVHLSQMTSLVMSAVPVRVLQRREEQSTRRGVIFVAPSHVPSNLGKQEVIDLSDSLCVSGDAGASLSRLISIPFASECLICFRMARRVQSARRKIRDHISSHVFLSLRGILG